MGILTILIKISSSGYAAYSWVVPGVPWPRLPAWGAAHKIHMTMRSPEEVATGLTGLEVSRSFAQWLKDQAFELQVASGKD
jgi:hypothetical protein